jgi:hypothetical protein
MRETQAPAILKLPQQQPSFEPSLGRKRRRLDLPMEPDKWLGIVHGEVYVVSDIYVKPEPCSSLARHNDFGILLSGA